jgi:hypothetical protein
VATGFALAAVLDEAACGPLVVGELALVTGVGRDNTVGVGLFGGCGPSS